MLQDQGKVGPVQLADGAPTPFRSGKTGEQIVGDAHGRYFEASSRGKLFIAHAIVTAPVIYTTGAGTGGPMVWNGSSNVNVNLIAMGVLVTTATSVAGGLGITGGPGQPAAPTSTTAIDSRGCLKISADVSNSTPYRLGTPTAAGTFFMPVANVGTTNVVTNGGVQWYDLGGLVTIPPQCWASVAANATLTSGVFQIGLVYEEVPIS